MPSIKSLVLALVLASRISSLVISDTRVDEEQLEKLADEEAFRYLLDQVDPPALHAALHDLSPDKFKHGAYHEDRTAAEVIHRHDPVLATSIVAVARRQADPSSNSSVPSTTVVKSVPTPTSDPASSVQQSESSTPTDSPPPSTSVVVISPSTPPTTVVVATSNPPTTIPQTSAPDNTPINPATTAAPAPSSQASSPTPSPSTPGESSPSPSPSNSAVASASDSSVSASSPGDSSSAASITNNSPSASEAAAASASAASASAASVSAASVSAAEASRRTSLYLQTTTLPNGAQSTITAVTYVDGSGNASPTGPGGSSDGGSDTMPSGSVQSQGAALRSISWGWEAIGVLGGALGFAMVL